MKINSNDHAAWYESGICIRSQICAVVGLREFKNNYELEERVWRDMYDFFVLHRSEAAMEIGCLHTLSRTDPNYNVLIHTLLPQVLAHLVVWQESNDVDELEITLYKLNKTPAPWVHRKPAAKSNASNRGIVDWNSSPTNAKSLVLEGLDELSLKLVTLQTLLPIYLENY